MEVLKALGELPDPQVALPLLRYSASFGKLVYSLRVVPHRKHSSALRCFDTAVRDCMESFLCCSFSDSEWTLASLSSKLGGLGLRNTEHHSPAAFLSSQAACHEPCSKLDTKYIWDPNDIHSNTFAAITDFNARVKVENQVQITTEMRPRQQLLSQAIDSFTGRIV